MNAPALDGNSIGRDLDELGYALTPPVLTDRQCDELVAGFDDDRLYRSTIDMQRHRFGSGVYRYFDAPLPPVVAELRHSLYRALAPLANEWAGRLGRATRFPDDLDAFLAECHRHGQRRPTPLIFRYRAGDFNALHQDLYGTVAFPLQAVTVLDRPGVDFTGGELLLVTQMPRQQSVGEAIGLERGRLLVFPNARRPVAAARGGGWRAVNVRHGVSRVRSGCRHTLGVILHDAT